MLTAHADRAERKKRGSWNSRLLWFVFFYIASRRKQSSRASMAATSTPQGAQTAASKPQDTTSRNDPGARNGRGRQAHQPSQFGKKAWKDILLRVKEEQNRDNLSLVAAGVSFYSLLAIVPALAAAVSIYGMFVSPDQMQSQFQNLTGIMPEQARQLIQDQLARIVGSADATLSLTAAVSILLALFSATKGAKAIVTALNIVYDEIEDRGFVALTLLTLAITLGAIAVMFVAMAVVVAFPALVGHLPLNDTVKTAIDWLRWPAVGLLIITAIGLIYRFAPDRDEPKWRWVTWGSVLATVLWLVASGLFSVYVSKFGSYNETYGSLGAVVVLLMWFWISAYVVLLGAEVNAEMEHQTARDTTRGPPEEMGARDAYVADTLGETRES